MSPFSSPDARQLPGNGRTLKIQEIAECEIVYSSDVVDTLSA